MKKQVLAFDFGASSGRAMLAKFDGEKITLEEKHRFSNDPVLVNDGFYWDVYRLFHEIKQGILKCVNSGDGDIDGIGIDTWGVDYGLLDKNDKLLEVVKVMINNETEGFQALLEKLKFVNIEELFYPMAGEINEEEYEVSLRETPACSREVSFVYCGEVGFWT